MTNLVDLGGWGGVGGFKMEGQMICVAGKMTSDEIESQPTRSGAWILWVSTLRKWVIK